MSFLLAKYAFQRLTRLCVVLIPALLLSFALDHAGMYFFKGSTNIYAGLPGADIAHGLAACATTAVMVGNVLFLQGIVTLPFGTNIPLWSLSFEFWFYALFPLLVVACIAARLGRLRLISGLASCPAGALWIENRRLLRHLAIGLNHRYNFSPNAEMRRRSLHSSVRRACGCSHAGLIVLAHQVDCFGFIVGIAFSVFMRVVLHYRSDSSSGIYRACAQRLSAMSYTLYLVHYPILAFLCALMMPHWHPWPLSPNSALRLLGTCTCVFLFAWCIYFCFERNTGRVRRWFATLNQFST